MADENNAADQLSEQSEQAEQAFSIFDELKQISILPTLESEFPPIRLALFRANKWEITEVQLYPFSTLLDVKYAIFEHIYDKYGEDEAKHWLPRYTFLGYDKASPDAEPSTESIYLSDTDFYNASLTGSKKAGKTNLVYLKSPLKLIPSDKYDKNFVDSLGNKRTLNIEVNGRQQLEQFFPYGVPYFHAFSLKSMLRLRGSDSAISQRAWNGKFGMYFPNIPDEGPYAPTTNDIAYMDTLINYIKIRNKQIVDANELLMSGYTSSLKYMLEGFKFIRLNYLERIEGFEGVETLFYNVPVNDRRPFFRLIPADGPALAKIHVKGVTPVPTVTDSDILNTWATEQSPIADSNYLMIKILLREEKLGIPPQYITLRILDDGTANLILAPTKPALLLEPQQDLANFEQVVGDAIAEFPISTYEPVLSEANIRIHIQIPPDAERMTTEELRRRIQYFSYFFQEIIPLEGDTPLIALRYKVVSLFKEESPVFAYFSQIISRLNEKEEENKQIILEGAVREFGITQVEAASLLIQYQEALLKWKQQYPKSTSKSSRFIESRHPGTDLFIYGGLQNYVVDIYRIKSLADLQRMYTMLALVLSVPADELEFDEEAANSFEESMREVQGRAEEDEEQLEEEGEPAIAVRVEVEGNSDESSLGDDAFEMHDMEGPASAGPMLSSAAASTPALAPVKVTAATPAALEEKRVAPEGIVDKELEIAPTLRPGSKPPSKLPKIKANRWFIQRLEKLDPGLFKYTPKLKTDNSYARQCGAADDKQPAVLTKEEFETMLNIYEKDGIYFIVYPFEEDEEPEKPPLNSEVYTIMKYGTNPARPNYYFCPPLFCLYDRIMVRPRDFVSEKDRRGMTKPTDSCPFCHGRLITDRKNKEGTAGFTVLSRIPNKASGKQHTFINFLKDTNHPEGFFLPCCYVKANTNNTRLTDKPFKHMKAAVLGAEEEDADKKDGDYNPENENADIEYGTAIEFRVALEKLPTSYIKKQEKYPLKPARFGLLSPGLDKYFAQKSETLVRRAKQELTPTATGFLRFGVDNRNTNESLLAALAPLLFKNSADEVRVTIKNAYTPKIFLYSHYGNLVNEFYTPADNPPPRPLLKNWARRHLQVDMTDKNSHSITRLFLAWARFRAFLDDPDQRKELRHLTPILAEAGPITPRGIHLVVLEFPDTEPGGSLTDPDRQLKIRCPSLGVNVDRHKRADIAFMTRDTAGVYELLVHTENKPAVGKQIAVHENTILFQRALQAPLTEYSKIYGSWSPIVKKRVDEFFEQCKGPGRGIFTAQTVAKPLDLVPLSEAIINVEFLPQSVVRDPYNHIFAVTFGERDNYVTFPVFDDGFIPQQLAIHFDITDYKPATIATTVRMYERLRQRFSSYKGYKIVGLMQDTRKNRIKYVKLANGLLVPVRESEEDDVEVYDNIDILELDESELLINKRLGHTETANPLTSIRTKRNQIDELYQHFRLSFAGWLTSKDAGSSVRRQIEEIIEGGLKGPLPVFEKRKRLEILLGAMLRSWMGADEEVELHPSFQRKDCRLIEDVGDCTGACVWREDNGTLISSPAVDEIPDVGVVPAADADTTVNADLSDLPADTASEASPEEAGSEAVAMADADAVSASAEPKPASMSSKAQGTSLIAEMRARRSALAESARVPESVAAKPPTIVAPAAPATATATQQRSAVPLRSAAPPVVPGTLLTGPPEKIIEENLSELNNSSEEAASTAVSENTLSSLNEDVEEEAAVALENNLSENNLSELNDGSEEVTASPEENLSSLNENVEEAAAVASPEENLSSLNENVEEAAAAVASPEENLSSLNENAEEAAAAAPEEANKESNMSNLNNANLMGGAKGRCLLHIPKQTEIGTIYTGPERIAQEQIVSTSDLFIRKLIDELIRFPNKRKQIYDNQVSKIATLRGAIRIGDQYIVPQRSLEWTELFAIDAELQVKEEYKFMEEMGYNKKDTKAPGDRYTGDDRIEMFPEMIEALNMTQEEAAKLALWTPESVNPEKPLSPLVSIMNLRSLRDLGINPTEKFLSNEALQRLANLKNQTIIVTTIREDQDTVYIKFIPQTQYPNTDTVLILMQNGETITLLTPAYLSTKFVPANLVPRQLGAVDVYQEESAPASSASVAEPAAIPVERKPTIQEMRARRQAAISQKAKEEQLETAIRAHEQFEKENTIGNVKVRKLRKPKYAAATAVATIAASPETAAAAETDAPIESTKNILARLKEQKKALKANKPTLPSTIEQLRQKRAALTSAQPPKRKGVQFANKPQIKEYTPITAKTSKATTATTNADLQKIQEERRKRLEALKQKSSAKKIEETDAGLPQLVEERTESLEDEESPEELLEGNEVSGEEAGTLNLSPLESDEEADDSNLSPLEENINSLPLIETAPLTEE